MQSWNQWGMQGGSYPMSGYPPNVQPQAAPTPAVPTAPTAAATTVGQYPMPYQWPNYTQTAPAAPAVASTWQQQQQQQQQQWEQWNQWQQQYAQWQQQYGKEYMAAMQAGQNTAATSSDTSLTPTGKQDNKKRPGEDTSANDPKKAKMDQDNAAAIQAAKRALEEMADAEKQFDEQFNNWESQFNSWREENANHPDTEQYKAYESKWTSWRAQLLQRREQMKKKKDAKLAELEKLQSKNVPKTEETPAQMNFPSPMAANANPYQNMYGNMSFPMGFNQPAWFGGQGNRMFPPVPPPIMPPSNLLDPNTMPPMNQDQSNEKSEGSIPGLDLLNPNGEKMNYNMPSMPMLSSSNHDLIQTPADNKPFDFPPPGKMGMMNNMSNPPPFRNQNFNQNEKKTDGIPSLLDRMKQRDEFQNSNNFNNKFNQNQGYSGNFNNFNQRNSQFQGQRFQNKNFNQNFGGQGNFQKENLNQGRDWNSKPLLSNPGGAPAPSGYNGNDSNAPKMNPPFGPDDSAYDNFSNFNDQPNKPPNKFQQGSNFNQRGNMGPNSQPPPDFNQGPPPPIENEKEDTNLPIYKPSIIFDYGHQPADLGVPEVYEPWSMIDYAHAPGDFPDEDNSLKNNAREPWMQESRQDGGNWRGSRSDDRPWENKSRDDFKDDRGRRRDDRRDYDKNKRDDRRWSERSPEDKYRDKRNFRDRRGPRRSRSRSNSMERMSGPPQFHVPNADINFEPPLSVPMTQVTVMIDDLIGPGRNSRPPRIVIIVRGPPGSGKSFLAKLIKDKEVQMGGSAPRILSLDDYFMVEEKSNGKNMEYEFEAAMEPQYRDSLVKSFKKTLTDGYFPFIIVDATNDKTEYYEPISSFAKSKGFQVYVCETDLDLQLCLKRNIHKRAEKEIEDIIKNWQKTPMSENLLDVRSLLQDESIMEVNMEDTTETPQDENVPEKVEDSNEPEEVKSTNVDEEADEPPDQSLLAATLQTITSKWDDMDNSINKLDRLDGLSKRKSTTTIKDWLQLPEDDDEDAEQAAAAVSQGGLQGGKKRVRWADLEERREQAKMRAIGFVVGHTDWGRMLDPTGGQGKLAQTKYI